MRGKVHIMGVFTRKSPISVSYALIGELGTQGDIVWNTADFSYCITLLEAGVLEDRGYRTVNDVHYRLFYLPPPLPYKAI